MLAVSPRGCMCIHDVQPLKETVAFNNATRVLLTNLPFYICVCVCVCVCSVAQLCLSLCGPRDCSPPGSSAHEIFQARILELGTISYSRVSS